jgi:hypothetical protein
MYENGHCRRKARRTGIGISLDWRWPVTNCFAKTKAIGDCGEARVTGLLRQAGLVCEQSSGYWPGYDIAVDGTIEVKHDLRAQITGNVFIETRHDGRLSGLAVTEATTYAFVVGDDIYLIATTKLRELAAQYPERIFKLADCTKTGCLLPLEVLRRHAVPISLNERVYDDEVF